MSVRSAQFLLSVTAVAASSLGGIAGVAAGRVVIIGGGNVGTMQQRWSRHTRVTIIDLSLSVSAISMRSSAVVLSRYSLELQHRKMGQGGRPPHWLDFSMPGGRRRPSSPGTPIKTMKKGSVVVDVAIDQNIRPATTATHLRTRRSKHGVVHYSVANIPGVSRTSTLRHHRRNDRVYALALANRAS